MRAVVDEVPHHEGALGELLAGEQFGELGRELELGDLGGGGDDPAEAGGLAVLEDGAPREGGDLAHGHGLGEEDGRVRVVAGG